MTKYTPLFYWKSELLKILNLLSININIRTFQCLNYVFLMAGVYNLNCSELCSEDIGCQNMLRTCSEHAQNMLRTRINDPDGV